MAIVPADIAPELIAGALRSRVIGRFLEVLAEIGSTNDVVMAAGRAGRPEGFAVVADRQTAGRGRRGHLWASPAGLGLYTSILLRPHQPPAKVPLLTLVAGLGVAHGIEEIAGVSTQLKWPNDVLVEGRKVAGILAEMATTDEQVSLVVLGIGINVNQGPRNLPEGRSPAATSLSIVTGKIFRRGEVAAAVFSALDRWYQLFCDGCVETLLAAGRERSATLGRSVDVLADGERWQGLAEDLDTDGALLVRQEGGEIRRVIASDVSIRTIGGAVNSQRAAGSFKPIRDG
jgi:BirA family biotin operon repressor/biotin-[acetyl-CoA-carboxylase] ligase